MQKVNSELEEHLGPFQCFVGPRRKTAGPIQNLSSSQRLITDRRHAGEQKCKGGVVHLDGWEQTHREGHQGTTSFLGLSRSISAKTRSVRGVARGDVTHCAGCLLCGEYITQALSFMSDYEPW